MGNTIIRKILIFIAAFVLWYLAAFLFLRHDSLAIAPDIEREHPVVALEAPVSVPKKAKASSCEDYRDLVSKYDWEVDIALQIMRLESGCKPWEVNDNPLTGDYSVGLFQINLFGDNAKYRPSEEWLKVPENNVAYAYKLYTGRKWKDWTTYAKIVR